MTIHQSTGTADNNKFYIDNAGMVLLWPFLHTAFDRIGYLSEGKFITKEKAFRAVCFLQYLVNGVEGCAGIPGHQLALNKLLSGLAIDEPTPLDITLVEQEKETGQQLLNAVITRWDKIKNTSADGLRQTFLQRQGALTFATDHWTLKVEHKTLDVLMNSLPWSISTIRTSWMDNVLFVYWR